MDEREAGKRFGIFSAVAWSVVEDHHDVLMEVFALEGREEGGLGVAVHGLEADEVEAVPRKRRGCREETAVGIAHLLWEHSPTFEQRRRRLVMGP